MDLNASIPTIVDSSSFFTAFSGQMRDRTEDVKRSLSLICSDKQRNLTNQLMDNFFMGATGDLHQDLMIWKEEEEQNSVRAQFGSIDDGGSGDDGGETMLDYNNAGFSGGIQGEESIRAPPQQQNYELQGQMSSEGSTTSPTVFLPTNRKPKPKRFTCVWPQCTFGCTRRGDLSKHWYGVHFSLGSTSTQMNPTRQDNVQEAPQVRQDLLIQQQQKEEEESSFLPGFQHQQQQEEEESSFLPGFQYQRQQPNKKLKPTFMCPFLGCAKMYYSKIGLDYHRRKVHGIN